MRFFAPLLFGIFGVAILSGLGVWQVQRLSEKRQVLAEIDAQISAQTVPIFSVPFQEFQAVQAVGKITESEVHVLTSRKNIGAGFRIISAFETEGRRILLDRGFVPESQKNTPRETVTVTITGNFRTVDETDRFTPPPDLAKNIHFSRDISVLARTLDTEPILIVLRTTSEPDPEVTPWPIDSAGIPNDHQEYAITWFSLALVWAGMTGFWLWRMRRHSL